MYYANPDKLLMPWTPVVASEQNGACKISVWGRTYSVADGCMPSSIISQNEELLAAPIRIVATENGEEITYVNGQCFLMDDTTPEAASLCCTAESGDMLINTTCKVEYDGYMSWTLSVAPRGRTVGEGYGLVNVQQRKYELTGLRIEIPLRAERFSYFNLFPGARYLVDGKEEKSGELNMIGMIPDRLDLPFCAQLYLSGDETGLAFICESQEHWQTGRYPFQVVRNGEEILLRIHLLDSQPQHWQQVDGDARRDMPAVTFSFNMIATPVKPLPANPYGEHSLHIDCAHKIPEDYEDFLFHSFVDTGEHTGLPAPGVGTDTGEITFDRIQRLGVKVLYLHEKWNTIQNCPYITRKSAQRIRKIVDEAHKRGIKVMPYFGFEVSTLAPYWGQFGEKFGIKAIGDREPRWWPWYRQPAQRAYRSCYADQEYRQILVEGIRHLVETFRFDGIYLDSTPYPQPCENERHGCGWRDDEGNLHQTYPFNAKRTLMRQLYSVLDPMGCIINCHSNMVVNFAAASFYHSIWDGESIQMPFLHGKIHELPDGYMRAALNFRSVGLPFYMLCYANAPVWTFRHALSMCLIYGVIPKPNNAGAPLEDMAQLWQILDRIPIETAQWHPFYRNDKTALVTNSAVKVSYYEYKDIVGRTCRVVFCANTKDTASETTIQFRDGLDYYKHLFGQPIRCKDGSLHVRFDGFNCAIFYTELNKKKGECFHE